MAYLNSLLVTGTSRFLQNIYANGITTTDMNVNSISSPSRLTFPNGLTVGSYNNSTYQLSANSIIVNNWLRTTGNSGWYNESYGGGWYMTDSTYIRNYNSKAVLLNNSLTVANGIFADYIKVTDYIKSPKWEINNVAQLGGEFNISPTIIFDTVTQCVINGNNVVIKSSAITDNSYAGGKWYNGSKVRVSGNFNGVIVTGAVATLQNHMNSTANQINFTFSNSQNLTNGTYTTTVKDVRIALVEQALSSNSGTRYPIGIYMTSYGDNKKPYINIYGGSSNNAKVVLGDIGELGLSVKVNGTDTNVNGWGLYADNVYLNGTIISNSGTIGGFTLGNNSLSTGSATIGTDVVISTGKASTTSVGGSGTASKTWALTMGNKFGVTTTGDLYANSATISGSIYSTSGEIGGFTIDSTSVHTKNVEVTSNADNSIALSSADFTRTINSISRSGLRFAIGDKFCVTGDGTVYASNVDLTGKITATSGKIGKYNITDTYLYTGTGSTQAGIGGEQAFWAGSESSSNAPFHVGYDGSIYSTSGEIGGFEIGEKKLSSQSIIESDDLSFTFYSDFFINKITASYMDLAGDKIIVLDKEPIELHTRQTDGANEYESDFVLTHSGGLYLSKVNRTNQDVTSSIRYDIDERGFEQYRENFERINGITYRTSKTIEMAHGGIKQTTNYYKSSECKRESTIGFSTSNFYFTDKNSDNNMLTEMSIHSYGINMYQANKTTNVILSSFYVDLNTSEIKLNSLTATENGFVHGSYGTLLYHNGTNLWLGAKAGNNGDHHTGDLELSAYNGTANIYRKNADNTGVFMEIIDRGYLIGGSHSFGSSQPCNANTVTTQSVSFPRKFKKTPYVICGFVSDSTGATMGQLSCSASAITATGFTIRVFNGSTSARQPIVHWLAFEQ